MVQKRLENLQGLDICEGKLDFEVASLESDSFFSICFSSPIVEDDIIYPSVVHYYQSQKATNWRDFQRVLNASSIYEAYLIGHKIELRKDWKDVRLFVMKRALELKFRSSKELIEKLIKTYPKEIIYRNNHHDCFWGYCSCRKCRSYKSMNFLGRLIMQIRFQFLKEKVSEIF